MQFQGRFTITKRDNVDFNLLLMRRSLIGTSIFVFAVVAAVVGLVKYARQGAPLSSALLQAIGMGLVGVVLLAAFNIVYMLLRMNSLYQSRQLTDFTYDARIDADGFHAASERGNSDVAWSRILSVVETKRAFNVFITDSNANVLPKAQIADADGLSTLRALFAQFMPAKRLRLQ